MKKLLFILFIIIPLSAFAQTEREILLEIVKQQATNNAKIDAMQKQMDTRFDAMQKQMDIRSEATQKQMDTRLDTRFDASDKRIDILFFMTLGVLAGVFGLISFVVWDRQVSIKPILKQNEEITKEMEELKEKVKTTIGNQEKITTILKRIIEIEPRFTGLL